jgi:hypothetical protein
MIRRCAVPSAVVASTVATLIDAQVIHPLLAEQRGHDEIHAALSSG